jgi:hypothetical protein
MFNFSSASQQKIMQSALQTSLQAGNGSVLFFLGDEK